MGSLLDSVKDSISPDVVRSLASTMGDSADGVKKAIETGAATILGTLARKAGETGFLSQIMSIISNFGTQTLGAAAGAGGAATAAASEAGSSLLTTLFGANRAAIEGKIAQAAGISPSAGSTILATAAPLVLSTLSSKVSGGVTGLASALSSELPSLRSMIPAGLPGVSLPNLAGAPSAARAAVEDKVGGSSWLWPVLLLCALLIGGLVWYFNRGTADVTKPAETAVATTQTAATDATADLSDATKAAWAKLGDLFKLKLADGTELSVPKLGVESKLVSWIESSKRVDKTTWFDFDRLLFATGSATLEPASDEQLANVAAILKAYPKVKIKLGGYTDNQGDPTLNKKLSGERAENVKAELVKLGVDPSRMEAEGYGEAHPVGDNNTEEGRAMNRRISLRVTEK
jgi:outer membrane protein OmpA-like peptidoglycan-associated protein